jgi:hypothetical protein
VIWLTWRQQRTETLVAALVLVLLAAVLVPTGLHMVSVYDHDGLGSCLTRQTGSCGNSIASFDGRFEHLGGLISWFNLLPGLLGILLAAPFVLELEHGTFRLAWTQSITRRRWLTTKLGLIGLGTVGAALVLTALMTWWRTPLDQLHGRMETNVFDFEGIVPFAYTLFAVALVIALGVLLRRTVLAIGGAFIGYLALRLVIQTWVRQNYVAPVRKVWGAGRPGPANLDRAWVLQSVPSDRSGHPLANPDAIFATCGGGARGGLDKACVQTHGLYNLAVYQPAGRFWLFQGIEAAIFGGLALALIGFAVWWVRNRVS